MIRVSYGCIDGDIRDDILYASRLEVEGLASEVGGHLGDVLSSFAWHITWACVGDPIKACDNGLRWYKKWSGVGLLEDYEKELNSIKTSL